MCCVGDDSKDTVIVTVLLDSPFISRVTELPRCCFDCFIGDQAMNTGETSGI